MSGTNKHYHTVTWDLAFTYTPSKSKEGFESITHLFLRETDPALANPRGS